VQANLSKLAAIPKRQQITNQLSRDLTTNLIYAHMARVRNERAITVLKTFAMVYAPNKPKIPEEM
jgi:outer membrane protein assembly factor BamD (BamD/ComL family)